ncbi:MAG: single-stranded DNA-binding protein [Mucilaginibacter sp.]|jgi:single-strand DNA-binding protein|uniref:single-stranded DNA-binding protein n=1 Tax=Mucilaginibacter sp. TaxID=1882438 RepID=UPI003562E15E
MATIKNSVRLIGNIGMDPDVRTFDNNRKMVRLSIATNDSYKNDKGEKVTDTQWHNIVLWGTQATMAESYLKKGDSVIIEGKLASRNYNDKDGVKRYVTEVVVNEFIKMGGKE